MLTLVLTDDSRCFWCHDVFLPDALDIRVCEGCHGLDSLHNIQADSNGPGNIGTIVVGERSRIRPHWKR